MESETMAFDETDRLGTELEVVADFDLTPLLEHLGARVAVLRNSLDSGRHTLWLELVPTEKDLEEAVGRYAAMVDALPQPLRHLWNASLDRCLNTGIQAGRRPPSFVLELSPATMALEAAIATRHRFTVYASQPTRAGSSGTSRRGPRASDEP